MEMIYLVLCVLCVGIVVFTTVKNEKLVKETHSAKKEYLNAKTNNLRLEQSLHEAMDVIRDSRDLNNNLRREMTNLRIQVNMQSGLITELHERVEYLEYDNKRLKQKLKIHDEVARRSKVVVPFKASM